MNGRIVQWRWHPTLRRPDDSMLRVMQSSDELKFVSVYRNSPDPLGEPCFFWVTPTWTGDTIVPVTYAEALDLIEVL